jgi:hypothetical protein
VLATYYWQLRYPDGRIADEPDETTSINVCPAGALWIVLTRPLPNGKREPVVRESMDHERLPKCGPWMPVFYRKRYRDVVTGPDGRMHSLAPRTQVNVFGRACESPNGFESRLWMMRNGAPIDCETRFIDVGSVQTLLAEQLVGRTR